MAKRRARPAKHDIVNAKGERDKDEDRDEPSSDVGSNSGDDEADNDEELADSNVPSALVVSSRSVRHSNRHTRRK